MTYAWDFGDGYTSALEDPVHTYAATGCYTVTLTVSNECGETPGPGRSASTSPYHYYYLPLVMGSPRGHSSRVTKSRRSGNQM